MTLDASQAAIYSFVEIIMDYNFISSFVIVNGDSILTASNRTAPSFGQSILIPTLSPTTKSLQTIWLMSVPTKTSLYAASFKFRFRYFNPASSTGGVVRTSQFDPTMSDKANEITLSLTNLIVICAAGGGGIIIFSGVLAWLCTKVQFKICPPKDYA